MIRTCDGSDPNLIQYVNPVSGLRTVSRFEGSDIRPCDCGREFDDVQYMIVWPHQPVDLIGWKPGITPTYVECPHGVIIGQGVYQGPTEPTGDHRPCWDAHLESEQEDVDQYSADLWDDYVRMISEGGL